MAHLIRMPRAAWRRQPAGSLVLNPAAPLLHHAALNGLAVVTAPVAKAVNTLVGTLTDNANAWRGGPNGESYLRATLSGNASSLDLNTLSGGTWVGSTTTPRTTNFLVALASNTTDGDWVKVGTWLLIGLSSNAVRVNWRTTAGYTDVSSDTVAINTPLHIAVVADWPNTTLTLCVNGKAYTGTLSGTGWYSTGFTNSITQIGYAGATAQRWVSMIGALRSANAEAALEWTENPYAIFHHGGPRFFLIPSSGPVQSIPVFLQHYREMSR